MLDRDESGRKIRNRNVATDWNNVVCLNIASCAFPILLLQRPTAQTKGLSFVVFFHPSRHRLQQMVGRKTDSSPSRSQICKAPYRSIFLNSKGTDDRSSFSLSLSASAPIRTNRNQRGCSCEEFENWDILNSTPGCFPDNYVIRWRCHEEMDFLCLCSVLGGCVVWWWPKMKRRRGEELFYIIINQSI